jgi:cytochrome c oxidase cbb3-type subunit III
VNHHRSRLTVACVAGWLLAACACEREARPFEQLVQVQKRSQTETGTELAAGTPLPPSDGTSPFQRNAWGQSEGKRLFSAYNCNGCHANGGGAIGPPLMDDEWIYGFRPENIFASIVEGRPDGMPSFRNKIPDYQVWQLVAYVQSMSGQTPIDTSPGRSDHLQARPPEIIQPYQGRVQTGHK